MKNQYLQDMSYEALTMLRDQYEREAYVLAQRAALHKEVAAAIKAELTARAAFALRQGEPASESVAQNRA
jgi:flagellar biosynthesis regulator FlbT